MLKNMMAILFLQIKICAGFMNVGSSMQSSGNPFDYVKNYPSELQGMWEGQIMKGGTTSCVMLFVQQNGFQFWISYPGYCSFNTERSMVGLQQVSQNLNMYSEGLIDYNCTGKQEGQLKTITSEGLYYCTTFKRESGELVTKFGAPSISLPEVICPEIGGSNLRGGDFVLGETRMKLMDATKFDTFQESCTGM